MIHTTRATRPDPPRAAAAEAIMVLPKLETLSPLAMFTPEERAAPARRLERRRDAPTPRRIDASPPRRTAAPRASSSEPVSGAAARLRTRFGRRASGVSNFGRPGAAVALSRTRRLRAGEDLKHQMRVVREFRRDHFGSNAAAAVAATTRKDAAETTRSSSEKPPTPPKLTESAARRRNSSRRRRGDGPTRFFYVSGGAAATARRDVFTFASAPRRFLRDRTHVTLWPAYGNLSYGEVLATVARPEAPGWRAVAAAEAHRRRLLLRLRALAAVGPRLFLQNAGVALVVPPPDEGLPARRAQIELQGETIHVRPPSESAPLRLGPPVGVRCQVGGRFGPALVVDRLDRSARRSRAPRENQPRGHSVEASRGDTAAATWMFRGGESRRHRGCDVDVPWRRVDASRWRRDV